MALIRRPEVPAPFYPLLGAALGAAGAGILELLSPALSREVAAALVILFWALVTGGHHEKDFAGSFGILTVALLSLLRWLALVHLATPPLPLMTAAGALSRASLVALAWIARPAAREAGASFAARLTSGGAIVAIVFGLAASALCPFRLGWAAVSLSILLVFAARKYFHARLGGVSDGALGTLSLFTESAILVLASCQPCSW